MRIILFYFTLAFMLSSCSMMDFHKRRYMKGYFHESSSSQSFNEREKCEAKHIEIPRMISSGSDQRIVAKVFIQTDRPASKPVIDHHIVLRDTIPAPFDSSAIVSLSPTVGKVIDKEEKIKYHLFPFFKTDDFVCAYFIQEKDGSLYLIGKMKDGTQKKIPYTMQQFQDTQMNNLNDEAVAKLKGESIGDEYGASKRSAGAVIAAFSLTALGLLLFWTSFAIFLPALLFLASLILVIIGTTNANRILRRHKVENKLNGNNRSSDFAGRSEAVFASRAGEVYLIIVGLVVLFIAWFFLSWAGVI